MSSEYPLYCPEVVSSPEWKEYVERVVSLSVPSDELTTDELRRAVKAQQTALIQLADITSLHQTSLTTQTNQAFFLLDQQKKLELLQLMAEHHSRQQDRELEAYRTASAVEAVKTMCDTVLEYSKNHKGEDYTHMAVKSIAQSTARILSSTTAATSTPSPTPPNLEDRVKVALSQGLRWNTNNIRPAKQSTVLKKLEEWERGINLANSISNKEIDAILSKSLKTVEIAYGKSFLIGLCDRLEASLNLPATSSSTSVRFKRLVASYRQESGSHSLPPSPESGDYIASVCVEMYGYEDEEVIRILNEKVKRLGGVDKLTPELLRKTSTVKRLPTFLPWLDKHKTPSERFNALKGGEYDHYYTRLVFKPEV